MTTMLKWFNTRNQHNSPLQHMKGEKATLDEIVKFRH